MTKAFLQSSAVVVPAGGTIVGSSNIVAAEKLRVITRSVITRNYFVITRPEIHYTKGVEK